MFARFSKHTVFARNVLVILCAAGCLFTAAPVAASVTIHIIDVGQGDATLVVSSSGQTLLFDAGWNGMGDDVVIPYIQSLGITELDYMVASHYHADHCGGLDEVYNEIGVGTACYDRGWSYTTITYNDYAAAVAAKRVTINDNQVIDLGDGVTATCIAVNGNGELSSPYATSTLENEYCVALHIECGDFDYFQAGDLTGGGGTYEDIETNLGPEAGDLEIYKVNHHGSYSSSNANFLTATTPEVAIISVGATNSYGHPAQSVLDRLQSFNAFVYQTTTGAGGTLPAADLRVVGGSFCIETDGYGEYTVDGDLWEMDEEDNSAVAPVSILLLHGNHPNPFNPATSITFTTETPGPALLEVFDQTGRRLFRRAFAVGIGYQSTAWTGIDDNGQHLPSGTYVYRLTTPDGADFGRMTMIK